jgi:hypothetical protein
MNNNNNKRKQKLSKKGRGKSNGSRSSLSNAVRISNVHSFTRNVSINQKIGTTGMIPQVGSSVGQLNFCIFFTTQDVFINFNNTTTIYSTAAVPGISDLSALFDEIQLARVEITIIGCNQPTAGAGSGSAVIVICKDYNDRNPPTSFGDVQQYQDSKMIHLQPFSEVNLSIQPKFLTYTLDTGGTSVASSPMTGYVRSTLQIDHYGFKGAVLNFPPSEANYLFSFKYYYNCRVVK